MKCKNYLICSLCILLLILCACDGKDAKNNDIVDKKDFGVNNHQDKEDRNSDDAADYSIPNAVDTDDKNQSAEIAVSGGSEDKSETKDLTSDSPTNIYANADDFSYGISDSVIASDAGNDSNAQSGNHPNPTTGSNSNSSAGNNSNSSAGGSDNDKLWYRNLDISRCNLPTSNKYLIFEYAYKYQREDMIAAGDKQAYSGFKDCMDFIYKYSDKSMQVKAAHDWLAVNVSCYGADIEGWFLVPGWSESPVGPFTYGKAMPEGYNQAFALCMKIIGVECAIVDGKYNGCPYETTEDTWGEAEWVNIKLDGSWYHIDIFHDDTYDKSGDSISYEYFNVTDSELRKDHTWTKERICDGTRYGYYDYYYDGYKIDTADQYIDYMAKNCDRGEFTLVIKNAGISDGTLYDYGAVSKKCGKFVIWRIYNKFSRGNYTVCKVYLTIQEKRIYPEIAHNVTEYYAIVNKILAEHIENSAIIVLDSSFEEHSYTDFKNRYAMDHDGYIERSHFYTAHFDTATSSNTAADAFVGNYRIANLTAQYVGKKYAGYVATTTQEFIDCVIKACEEEKPPLGGANGVYMFVAIIAVKDGGSVTNDIEIIKNGFKAKYPLADIFTSSVLTGTGEIRNGYTEWRIMGMC